MLNDIAYGIIIALLFITIVVVFCIIIIRLYIKKTTKHNQIIFQKTIEFQKTINSTIIETQEQVLQNISQELHDDAGQQLTYINFQLEKLKLNNQETNNLLSPISQSVNQLSETIRSLSHSLNNQILSQKNLLKAIAITLHEIQKNTSLKTSFTDQTEHEIEFSSNEKIVLYRIFQEIVNNALKHSQAKTISVIIEKSNSFKMTIFDDGIGFNTQNAMLFNKTNGLQNIILRAKLINFEATIDSKPNHGTVFTICKLTA
jgi:signal transduction histidine kinase